VSVTDILDVTNRVKTPAELEDADMDGLLDTWEYANFPTDLTKLSGSGNLDGDGLTDAEEYALGTDPNNVDTDGDNLQDEVENGTGMWVSITNTGTNPLVADTDGDGFRDDVENNLGTWVSQTNPGTNPNLADTDIDGFSDFVEGPNGYEPSDNASFPVFKDDKYLMAYWKFDDATTAIQAVDEVNDHAGVVTGTFSAEGTGATLTGTDRAMCFGPGQNVLIDGTFANLASAGNKITISFWQKLTAVGGSAFWINSESAGAGTGNRGIQAHSPHSDGKVYFDHSGCCTNNVTRINSGDLRGTAPGQIDVGQWQHYAYVKDGDVKRVYIDGIEALSGFGTAPLVNDFANLYIGSTNAGASMNGCIDEFSIFAGALSPYQVTQLAGGTSADTVLDATAIYETWATASGLTPGVNDGVGQNPDFDGLNNLLEFAFGTDPRVSNPAPVSADFSPPFIPTNVNAQFVRRINHAAAGLTYVAEFSADLVNWEASDKTPSFVSSQSADYEVVNLPYTVILDSGKKATYFRIRVNSSETGGINP
jgi:hypothetical protein